MTSTCATLKTVRGHSILQQLCAHIGFVRGCVMSTGCPLQALALASLEFQKDRTRNTI